MTGITLDQLREQVGGDVIAPGNDAYDEARTVYNAMIDRRPAVVVRAVSAQDVAAAVNFARENGLDLAVRGGGHSVPGFGTCDDGVVSTCPACVASPSTRTNRTARAEGGATWGDFNDATHVHGLATTGGIISTTGVGGLTLGGGIGYLARGFGLSCDNLISADVVTADGRIRDRERGRERRPLLGAPRRRRQLRGRHVVRVPAAPGRDDLRRPDVLRGRGCRHRAALLPGVHRRCPRGVRRVPGVADRAAAAVHPGGPPRRHVPRVRRLLGGPSTRARRC